MRDLKYLSPSSIKKFLTDKEQFYLEYLADNREDRMPQTEAMSVGSAFDAYVKAYLYKEMKVGDDTRYDFEALFETQVEPHNRDFARVAGRTVFDAYVALGGLSDLFLTMTDCSNPRFEFSLIGGIDLVTHELVEAVEAVGAAGTVVLSGKPDLHFYTPNGNGVIFDWKVNGFCSRSKPSPCKGYLKYRDISGKEKAHKDCLPMKVNDTLINAACYLETANEDWGRQLAIYGWLMGEAIGSLFLTAIDQIICCDGKVLGLAQQRTWRKSLLYRISSDYQLGLLNQIEGIWRCTHGRFFEELSESESRARCDLLDGSLGAGVYDVREGLRER